jgi:site-specific DNA-methyltransferase (adenine-specific)
MIDDPNQRRIRTNGLRFTLGLTKAIIREEKDIEMLNKIYCGDNLEFMHSLPDECIDLIYSDPPLFGEVLSYGAKCDDYQHYLTWLSERLKEMHRILKTTGSIYLHCSDSTTPHLKCKMDKIFGEKNWKNNIVWGPPKPGTIAEETIKEMETIKEFETIEFGTILFYTKSQKYTCNPQYIKKLSPIYEIWKLYLAENFIIWELPNVKRNSKENLNYPTQKPEALLERIIKLSANTGDIVFDPFCGSGTSFAVAKRLGMQFVGIDINPIACKISKERISCLK